MECDIIIPVWNQPQFTKDCVNSILKNTDVPYSMIFVDNASDDEAARYLESLKTLKRPSVSIITNSRNLGFVKAVNQGMRASASSYLCVLNNDTIVTDGWLKEMMDVANSSKAIGIVNPSSNNLGQRPADSEPFAAYAAALKKERGKFIELGSAIGFCMLIKREVLDRIGQFDEIYGMGNYEDTDYCRRAVKEGYRCVRACGSYVYHREGGSFNKLKSYEADFKRNKEIYEFRWGRPKRIAYVLDSYDANILKRLEADSIKLARDGNWVWYFSKDHVELPPHSNIISVELGAKRFYTNVLFRILKKKKKFDEISVGEDRFGKMLEKLAFIHKARVAYYRIITVIARALARSNP